jgi:hypothetical protein
LCRALEGSVGLAALAAGVALVVVAGVGILVGSPLSGVPRTR